MAKRSDTPKRPLVKAKRERATVLSIVLQGDEPPSEFRIFTAGKVETSKGTFTFDEVAAKAVMADYATQGNELMVDYDHASIAGISLDPSQSGKAAGWFGLEVRAGELWAVNVRWTPGAATALRAKEWRYMSPAFATDEEGRVTSVLNVALTNIPATRNLEPLMAANAKETLSMLSPETVKKALEAIKNGDSDAAMALLEEMIAGAAGGEEPSSEAKPDAAAGETAPAKTEEEKPEEVAAALSSIARLSGKSLVASIADIEIWYASHVKLETETKKLAAERATLESAERRKGCADMVIAGVRKPAEVWADEKANAPKAYLAAMPIDGFRAYVKDAMGAKPAGAGAPVTPPPSGGVVQLAAGETSHTLPTGEVVKLSARENAMCVEMSAKAGRDLKEFTNEYAARKAATTKKAD